MKTKNSSQSGILNLRTITLFALFPLASLLTYFSFATPPSTITVNSNSPAIADDGFCTLPEAIIAANTGLPSGTMSGECPGGGGPSGSTIIVLSAPTSTYTLVQAHNALYGFNGLPGVTSTITIQGNGAIIQNFGAISASAVPVKFRLFYISPSGNLTLQNLTVTGGLAQGGDGGVGFFGGGGGGGLGGAIYNQGTLTLNGVTLNGNRAQGGAGGAETASTTGFGGGGGGGGLGGTGGDNTTGYGGGGGGGFGGNGGKAGVFATTNDGGGGGGETIGSDGGNSTPAGPGAGGGTAGGAGGAFAQPGTNGLTGGGGGGGGSQGVGGGGDGGAGGGGGGGNFDSGNGDGGDGGIGGGGGGGTEAENGGAGGAGGGGGGSGSPGSLGGGVPGSGGFGGGNGQVAGGGGGGLGGAIFNDTGATLTIFNSTLSGNSATGGAGGASSTLTSGNGGSGFGGAIFNLNGTVTIDFSTIANNTVTAGAAGTSGGVSGAAGTAIASDVYNHQQGGTATMNVRNTVLGGTPLANCANDGGAVLASGGYNVAQTPGATCGFAATADVTGIDPMLLALASNGGPTQTQALNAGSTAIDRIPNGSSGCQQGTSFDQRTAPRAGGAAGLGGTACDSGAYEFDSTPGATPIPTPTPPVHLVSVMSHMTHGTAGDYNVDFPLTGTRGVEPRSSGALGPGNYLVLMKFSCALTTVGGFGASESGCTTIGASGSCSGDTCSVNLTGVCNAGYAKVTLMNVNDSCGEHSDSVSGPDMGFLIGDVNASGRVDAADVSSVRQQTLQPITASNFRDDINVTGRIDAADVSVARQQTLTSLPSPP